MIYTPLVYKAMHIACNAHHGQQDKSGAPYIFHPIHLAEQMDDEVSCCAALLHDVVEDTSVTLDDLRKDFPEDVIQVVKLLTHDGNAEYDNMDYFDYIRAIKKHPVAKKVKLADLAHNSDQSRCIGSDLTEEKLAYWKDKYEKATKILLED